MVSYVGRFAPAVAVSPASMSGGEPMTELASHSNTKSGDAILSNAVLGRVLREIAERTVGGRLSERLHNVLGGTCSFPSLSSLEHCSGVRLGATRPDIEDPPEMV